MGSNKLIPLLGGLVLLVVIFVGLKSCGNQDSEPQTMKSMPVLTGKADTDSPADTIRSLTAEVDELTQNSLVLKKQNEKLLRQKRDIEQHIETKLIKRLDEKMPETKRIDSAVGNLTNQLAFFRTRLDELAQAQQETDQADIPVGFGLDGAEQGETLVWVEPLGTQLDEQGNSILPASSNTFSKKSSAVGSLLHPNQDKRSTQADEGGISDAFASVSSSISNNEKPVYTVPRNSTLIGSTSMTALIGRIPIKNVVQEPFPFKVIVGKENLAANGIDMPQLDGMIFSGKSSGDWTLSCVRGTVHSVTYVFTDGTIRTLSSDEQNIGGNQAGSSKNQLSQNNRPLGWISDRRGIPCISGQRISNASDYLAGRVFARAASSAAEALAQNEVTRTVSPVVGAATSIVTGDTARYAGYNALSGGVDELAQYLKDRTAQSFDVVYVDTGVELAVHVDVELPIDYETQGRKVRYAMQINDSGDFLD